MDKFVRKTVHLELFTFQITALMIQTYQPATVSKDFTGTLIYLFVQLIAVTLSL
jgi:hypothetical protein